VKPEIKADWLNRLRSGTYEQGRGRLRTEGDPESGEPDRYCCLGILCEAAVDAGIVERTLAGYQAPHTAEQLTVLPGRVALWAGLKSNNPTIAGDKQLTLAEHNDGLHADTDGWSRKPKTFAEIADLIEKHL